MKVKYLLNIVLGNKENRCCLLALYSDTTIYNFKNKTTERFVLMPLFITESPSTSVVDQMPKCTNDLELSSFMEHDDFEGIKLETHKGLKK